MNPFPKAHLFSFNPPALDLPSPFLSSTTSRGETSDDLSATDGGETRNRGGFQAPERWEVELHRPTKKSAIPVLRFSRKLFSADQLALIDMQSRHSSISRTSRNVPRDQCNVPSSLDHTEKADVRKTILKHSLPPKPTGKRVKSEPVPVHSEQTTFPKRRRADSGTGFHSIWAAIMQKKKVQNLSTAVKQAKKEGRAGKVGVPGVTGKMSKSANRPFRCTVAGCDKGTGHVHILDNRVRSYECDIPNCGAKYVRKGDLKKHKLKKHRVTSNILCPEPGCNLRFSAPTQVAAHVRFMHHGPQLFLNNVSLPGNSAEMKSADKNCENMLSVRKRAGEPVSSIPHAVKSFQCTVKGCEKMFGRKYDCQRHIR